MYTCQDKAYTALGDLGSIKDISFKKSWFSEETRNKIYKLNAQVSCSHHCISHSKNILIHEYLNLNEDHLYLT